MLNAERCWDAVARRDAGVDGTFFFGVLTTGVYCRPSCPARRPLRDNVRFYGTPEEAERDGLRPCLRCRPRESLSSLADAKILELCGYIESHSEERLPLAELAARAGLSKFHFQRRFKVLVGLTPKEYLIACRMRALKQGLRAARGVTEAVYDAGFGSASRVYERAGERLGMTPAQYRRKGQGLAIDYAEMDTPAGRMMIGATARGVCFIEFGDSTAELVEALRKEYPAAELRPVSDPERSEFRAWIEALGRHFTGSARRLELPLDVRATAFQARVWEYLKAIPYGEVRSYGEVAAGIGRPTASRAVARACASNPVAVAIPCHRVVASGGALGGYRWGVERKKALLEAERRTVPGKLKHAPPRTGT